MNREDLVSLEVAKKLKEKGYNKSCEYFYCKMYNQVLYTHSGSFRYSRVDNNVLEEGDFLVPYITDVQKWLLNVYNIFVGVSLKPPFHFPNQVVYFIQDMEQRNDRSGYTMNTKIFFSTGEALDAGFLETLKLI